MKKNSPAYPPGRNPYPKKVPVTGPGVAGLDGPPMPTPKMKPAPKQQALKSIGKPQKQTSIVTDLNKGKKKK